MDLLKKEDIERALRAMGEAAVAEGVSIRLLVVGGAAMALAFDARQSTRDDDIFWGPAPPLPGGRPISTLALRRGPVLSAPASQEKPRA